VNAAELVARLRRNADPDVAGYIAWAERRGRGEELRLVQQMVAAGLAEVDGEDLWLTPEGHAAAAAIDAALAPTRNCQRAGPTTTCWPSPTLQLPGHDERFWYTTARRMTVVALSTGLRRGELLVLSWQAVSFLESRLSVVQQVVRNEVTSPKSRAGRRTLPLGPMAAAALAEQYQATRYRDPECIVFSHPALGTPLDPSKLSTYARKALTKAGLPESFRPWHGLRHTALTETAAAGVPSMFVQAKAGHAHGSTTERYLHAHKTSYPDAAELAEARLFSSAIASISAKSTSTSPGS
jgi:hypothetical protein